MVDYAYQPIVSATSLRVHGFEALARLSPEAGCDTVHELLDHAWNEGTLPQTERALLASAAAKFARLQDAGAARLFCNVDNRVFDDQSIPTLAFAEIARGAGLNAANFCIELSERTPPRSLDALAQTVEALVRDNLRIAIDDFGQGFSGLNMLLRVEPHYVKIDREFIDGVAFDRKKLAIVSKLCGLAHALGFVIVAEGVENEADFRAVRDLGCDLVQGYLIAKPTTELSDLRMVYDHVATSSTKGAIPSQVADLITDIPPLRVDSALADAVAVFKASPNMRLLPVVDSQECVRGAVYEEDVRRYLLTEYGSSLLANKGISHGLGKLVRRCPVGDAGATVDAIVNSYVSAESADGLVLTLDGRYLGYLTNHAVLRIAAERDVAAARDQNPLTYLPGNTSIVRHVAEVLRQNGPQMLAIFDFDNFKALNDTYGFVAGDRALLMFADLLSKAQRAHHGFAGHIGGDDFFLSLPVAAEAGVRAVRELTAKFSANVASLYNAEDRARSGIEGVDRFGQARFFPLLRASAAIVALPVARAHLTADQVNAAFASGKAIAKQSVEGYAIVPVPRTAVEEYVTRIERRRAG